MPVEATLVRLSSTMAPRGKSAWRAWGSFAAPTLLDYRLGMGPTAVPNQFHGVASLPLNDERGLLPAPRPSPTSPQVSIRLVPSSACSRKTTSINPVSQHICPCRLHCAPYFVSIQSPHVMLLPIRITARCIRISEVSFGAHHKNRTPYTYTNRPHG